ncbi:hypothetical protein Peur_024759 [Populus x canadensis]
MAVPWSKRSMNDEEEKNLATLAIDEFGDGESHSDAVVVTNIIFQFVWFTSSLRRQGTDEIEGIVIDLQEPEDMHLSAEVFKKVKRLRIVIIRKALFEDGSCKSPNFVKIA